jgi:hypothetical protein
LKVFVLLSLVGACSAATDAKTNWSSQLSLNLFVKQTTKLENKILLTATLQNVTSEALSIIVSTKPHPLSIVLLTPKGKRARLNELVAMVKSSSNPGQEMTIKPKEKVMFNRYFDLSEFNQEIADKAFVEFSASFAFTVNGASAQHTTKVDSNKAKYFISNSRRNP